MKHIFIVLAIWQLYSCTAPEKKDLVQSAPNILLIISDDQAWTDYSFMGHPIIETPRIDKLSEQGLTFTRGYVVAPLCRPSLASISTGLYPHQHNVTGNDPVFEFDGRRYSREWMEVRSQKNLPVVEKFNQSSTIQDFLKDKGYVSYQTGKWWEGSWKDGGFTNGMTHGDWSRGGRHGDEGLKVSRESMQGVFDFMKNAHETGKPFFVWHAPFMPHTPHTPPDSLLQKYAEHEGNLRIANYMAMVEWFDITVGQLLDYLETLNIHENTMIIYVCDNGWITNPDPKEGEKQFAPRSKQSPYEKGIRTPIMYTWPGVITPQLDTTTFVTSIDILPTILGAVRIEKPESLSGINVLDGASLHERQVVFSEDFTHDMADIDEITQSLESRVILKRPWKLIVPHEANNQQPVELFNIVEDPYEKINLASAHKELVEELIAQLDEFWNPEVR